MENSVESATPSAISPAFLFSLDAIATVITAQGKAAAKISMTFAGLVKGSQLTARNVKNGITVTLIRELISSL